MSLPALSHQQRRRNIRRSTRTALAGQLGHQLARTSALEHSLQASVRAQGQGLHHLSSESWILVPRLSLSPTLRAVSAAKADTKDQDKAELAKKTRETRVTAFLEDIPRFSSPSLFGSPPEKVSASWPDETDPPPSPTSHEAFRSVGSQDALNSNRETRNG